MEEDRKQTQAAPINEILDEKVSLDNQEPILKDNPNRFVLFPIQHDDIWDFYKKSQASFWTAEEIGMVFFCCVLP